MEKSKFFNVAVLEEYIMKRYLTILVTVFFSFVFSHLAIGAEWNVERGDTIWKILKEGCRVSPSMKKAGAFAQATGIENPDLIFAGTSIDISQGCATFSKRNVPFPVPAVSLETDSANAQAIASQITSLEATAKELHSKLGLLQKNDEAIRHGVYSMIAQYTADVEVNQKLERRITALLVALGIALLLLCLSVVLLKKKKIVNVVSPESGIMEHREPPTLETLSGGPSLWPIPANAVAPIHPEFEFLGSLHDTWLCLKVPFTLRTDLMTVQAISFWRVIPLYAESLGYRTFRNDESGGYKYVGTIEEFERSARDSIRTFMERDPGIENSDQGFFNAMKCGLCFNIE